MTRKGGWSLVIGFVAIFGAIACGDAEPSEEPQASDAQDPTGTPVTHDEASTEEALISGTLDGSLDCLWLEVGDERHALILPSGSATQQSGDEVILLDGDGNEVARSGDEVTISGGFRQDEAPCADADATGSVIVAGAMERSAN